MLVAAPPSATAITVTATKLLLLKRAIATEMLTVIAEPQLSTDTNWTFSGPLMGQPFFC